MANIDPQPLRPGVSTLRCPSCGGTVAIRVPGQTVTVICQNCNTSLDLAEGAVAEVVKYQKRRIHTDLSIGIRGKLRGQELEVIGMLKKREDAYSWEEYLLFNPRLGFRWLVHDQGHWSFGTAMPVPPVSVGITFTLESFQYADSVYKRYHIGKPTVSYVIGEFYWRVREGDAATTIDFIAPPTMLSAERTGKEINWTTLDYIEPSEIAAAFAIVPDDRTTIAPHQPDPNIEHRRTVSRIAIAVLAIALLIQIGFAVAARNQRVIAQSLSAVPENGQPIVIGPLELQGRTSPVEVNTYASVNNTWLDINVALVNDKDESSYEFTQSIAQYSGRDSDGYWSEGGNSQSSLIPSVPSGTYHLLIEPSSGSYGQYQPYSGSFQIQVTRGVQNWSTFWIVLLPIVIYPAWLFLQRHLFLVKRWANSEFTPYSTDDDE